jgi:AraC-like DNA-binding protein
MLIARGQKCVGAASVRYAFAFARGVWCKLIEGKGVEYDSRYIPPTLHPPKPNACLCLMAQGVWRTFGAPDELFASPYAQALSSEQFEGAYGRHTYTFRISGDHLWIEIYVLASALVGAPRLPWTLELDDGAWAVARRAATLSQSDDAAVEANIRELLTRLADLRVLDMDVVSGALTSTPKTLQRLWRAIQPLIERLAVSFTLEDLRSLAGLSTAQIERELQNLLGTLGLARPGIRSLTHHMRLKAAVLFLSAEGASIAEVAEVAGYRSVDAMARAFRDAGLAPPSVVRKELREGKGSA